jgi:hypothetical protein
VLKPIKNAVLRSTFLGTVLLSAVIILGAPAGGNAATFTAAQNSDECSTPCGIIAGNTVTISDVSAGVIDVKASLPTSWSFITTGAGDLSFAFSSSLSGLTLAIQSDTTNFAQWTTAGPLASGMMDGLKYPASFYGADANFSPSGGAGNNIVDLHISATGLTAATFVADLLNPNMGSNPASPPALFAADVLNTNNGNTGIIDFGAPHAVPLPAALPLFATGIGGLGLLGWRRKRKAQAFA